MMAKDSLLYDPARHELLRRIPWDEGRVRAAIEWIVMDTDARFEENHYWPLHPLDREGNEQAGRVETPLYHGAIGVIWALRYLQAASGAALSRSYVSEFDRLLLRNRVWLGEFEPRDAASFLMGETPIRMMALDEARSPAIEDALESLLAGNIEHPARDLFSGSPGSMLAALFLYERTNDPRWSELFRRFARKLWSQLEWSPEHQCSYLSQEAGTEKTTHLDAVHGFAGAFLPLIRGRGLLDAQDWEAWENGILTAVRQWVDRIDAYANWRPQLDNARDARKKLLQFCHGAPGFVVCLAEWPTTALDDLLLAAGETIWAAGPLAKGSNLCHGTGGNGYAFLKLHRRTGDSVWLERARSFAMHGIAQTQESHARYGHLRYSLWSGDLGFAIYLWDCLRAQGEFPTLDVFYHPRNGETILAR